MLIGKHKKFEPMLTRCAKTYSSTCSQIVLVDLQPFRRNLLLKCAPQLKIAKIDKTPYFGSSESFKVIDVDTTKKLITNVCCDRQHTHAYMQPFSRKTGQQRQNNNFSSKITTFMGIPLFDARAHCTGFLEPMKSRLRLRRRNLRSIPKISYTAFPCLSLLISAQFAAQNCQNLMFKVIQGHCSRCH